MKRSLLFGSLFLLFPLLAKADDSIQITVEHVEALQIVQDSKSTVPLLAGRPTVVRFYFSSPYTKNTMSLTADALVASTGQVIHADTPLRLDTNNNINSVDFSTVRLNRRGSLNFVIQGNDVGEGNLQVSLVNLRELSHGLNISCDGCDKVSSFPIEPKRTLKVRLIGFQYGSRVKNGATIQPRPEDFEIATSWLKRLYPASEVKVTTNILPLDEEKPEYLFLAKAIGWKYEYGPDCRVVDLNLQEIRGSEVDHGGGIDRFTHYYGLVQEDLNGRAMQGCALAIPDVYDSAAVASGPSGIKNPSLSERCEDSQSYAGCQVVHEIAHELGRQHPGFCDQDSSDPGFPRDPNIASGQISPPGDYIGWDVGDSTHGMRLLGGSSAHDLMTYCANIWPSGYTARALKRALDCEAERFINPQKPLDASLCNFRSKEFLDYARGPEGSLMLPANVTSRLETQSLTSRVEATWARRQLLIAGSVRLASLIEGAFTPDVNLQDPDPTAEAPDNNQATKIGKTEDWQAPGIRFLAVVDTSNLTGKIVSVTPVVEELKYLSSDAPSSLVSIEARDENDNTLLVKTIDVAVATDRPIEEKNIGYVRTTIPIPLGVKSLVLKIGGRVIDRKEFAGKAPPLKIAGEYRASAKNSTAGPPSSTESVFLSWRPEIDFKGSDLTYTVQRSDDGGNTWETIAAATHATELQIPAPPNTRDSIYRVIATNGLTSTINKVDKLPVKIDN